MITLDLSDVSRRDRLLFAGHIASHVLRAERDARDARREWLAALATELDESIDNQVSVDVRNLAQDDLDRLSYWFHGVGKRCCPAEVQGLAFELSRQLADAHDDRQSVIADLEWGYTHDYQTGAIMPAASIKETSS